MSRGAAKKVVGYPSPAPVPARRRRSAGLRFREVLRCARAWSASCPPSPSCPSLAAPALAQPAAAPQAQTAEDRLLAAMHGISSHTILDWVKEMAAEKYAGRLTGTPTYDASAAWTADLLTSWKFKPGRRRGHLLSEVPEPLHAGPARRRVEAARAGPGRRHHREGVYVRGRVLPGLDVRFGNGHR